MEVILGGRCVVRCVILLVPHQRDRLWFFILRTSDLTLANMTDRDHMQLVSHYYNLFTDAISNHFRMSSRTPVQDLNAFLLPPCSPLMLGQRGIACAGGSLNATLQFADTSRPLSRHKHRHDKDHGERGTL